MGNYFSFNPHKHDPIWPYQWKETFRALVHEGVECSSTRRI